MIIRAAVHFLLHTLIPEISGIRVQGEFLSVIVRKVLAVARVRSAVVLEGETEGGALAGGGALEGDLGVEG